MQSWAGAGDAEKARLDSPATRYPCAAKARVIMGLKRTPLPDYVVGVHLAGTPQVDRHIRFHR